MAGFNIKEFAAHMNANGLMRNNKFLVKMGVPPNLQVSTKLLNVGRQIQLMCDSASLPGVAIQTSETRRYGYGPAEKYGFAPIFNNVQMTFVADKRGSVHDFFYNWTKLIANYENRNGNLRQFDLTNPVTEDQRVFEISYKDDYKVLVEIIVFNDNGKEIMKVTLYNAFPTAVGDVQLNWNDTGDFVRIPVSFTYANFYVDYYSD